MGAVVVRRFRRGTLRAATRSRSALLASGARRTGVDVARRGRTPLSTIARSVAVAIGQACLSAATCGGPETRLRDAWDAQSSGSRLRHQRRGRRGRGFFVRHGPRVTARDDHLAQPLPALITRPRAGWARCRCHAWRFDRRARTLQHRVAAVAGARRFVAAGADVVLARDAVDLVVRRVCHEPHRARAARARPDRADRERHGREPCVPLGARCAHENWPSGGLRATPGSMS